MKKLFLIPLAFSLAIGIIPKPVSATSDSQNTSPYDVLIKIPCNIKDEDIEAQPPADVPQFKVQCQYGKDAFYEHFEGTGNPEQDLQKATEIAKSLNLTKMFYGDYTEYGIIYPNGGGAMGWSVRSEFKSIANEFSDDCSPYQVYNLEVEHDSGVTGYVR